MLFVGMPYIRNWREAGKKTDEDEEDLGDHGAKRGRSTTEEEDGDR